MAVAKINPERLAAMMEMGRDMVRKKPASTFEIRNSLETLGRLIPDKSQVHFGTGAVAKSAEHSIRNAANALCAAILNCPV